MGRKESIIVLTNGTYPYNSPAADLVRLFSEGLVINGRDITVLVQTGREKNGIPGCSTKTGTLNGVKYKFCSYIIEPKGFKKIIDKLRGLTNPAIFILKKRLKKQLDAVITYNTYFTENLFLLLICKVTGVKIVNYQVDIFTKEWYLEKMSNKIQAYLKHFDYKIQHSVILKLYNGGIVISKYLQREYLKSFRENQIHLVPQLADIRQSENNDVSYRSVDDKQITIGAIGPLNDDGNGISDLLSAFKVVQSEINLASLILIGGPESAVEYY